jgi:hypothetical protein
MRVVVDLAGFDFVYDNPVFPVLCLEGKVINIPLQTKAGVLGRKIRFVRSQKPLGGFIEKNFTQGFVVIVFAEAQQM